jgi:hypothetical protein
MLHRKGHHRDKRPSMVSEMGTRVRGSYGNLQHNYNSRTNTFGSNRAISLDHYNHHRRMSDVIQTVTSDSTVYYHQRLNEHDVLSRAAAAGKNSSNHGSADAKLACEDLLTKGVTENPHNASDENEEPNRVLSNNNCSLSGKNLKSKLSSSVSCSNSPKSIITRLRQLTGRLSFSFDKESRRAGSGTQAQIIKTSPSKSSNASSFCCNAKCSEVDGRQARQVDDAQRNRAYSLDVPASKCNNSSSASSYNGSHKSLSSHKNEEVDDSLDTKCVSSPKSMCSDVENAEVK